MPQLLVQRACSPLLATDAYKINNSSNSNNNNISFCSSKAASPTLSPLSRYKSYEIERDILSKQMNLKERFLSEQSPNQGTQLYYISQADHPPMNHKDQDTAPRRTQSVAISNTSSVQTVKDHASLRTNDFTLVCENLIATGKFERLERFLWAADLSNGKDHKTNSSLSYLPSSSVKQAEIATVAKCYLAFRKGLFPVLYQLLQGRHFSKRYHRQLQYLWRTARYIEAERARGRSLGSVGKYRIRRKFPLPDTIWDGECMSYCFREEARALLNETYKRTPYPSATEKYALAQKAKLSVIQVSNWFKNKRQRARAKKADTNPVRLTAGENMTNEAQSFADGSTRYAKEEELVQPRYTPTHEQQEFNERRTDGEKEKREDLPDLTRVKIEQLSDEEIDEDKRIIIEKTLPFSKETHPEYQDYRKCSFIQKPIPRFPTTHPYATITTKKSLKFPAAVEEMHHRINTDDVVSHHRRTLSCSYQRHHPYPLVPVRRGDRHYLLPSLPHNVKPSSYYNKIIPKIPSFQYPYLSLGSSIPSPQPPPSSPPPPVLTMNQLLPSFPMLPRKQRVYLNVMHYHPNRPQYGYNHGHGIHGEDKTMATSRCQQCVVERN